MKEKTVWEDLVTVGRVARPHGRRGEVVVNLESDFPERFQAVERVYIVDAKGMPVALTLERAWLKGERPVLKLAGVDTISEAEALSGKEIRLPEEELLPLGPNAFYTFRLRGLSVWDRRSGRLGTVEDVVPTGGCDLLVVRSTAGEELLVPLCEEICGKIAPESGRIEIEAPEGLLTLNAD